MNEYTRKELDRIFKVEKYKYETFQELNEANINGELEGLTLYVDNDNMFMYDESEEVCLFRAGGPHEVIHELLYLLGIDSRSV